jgi:2,4-dienoyl-CoA reductase-like NADH-dependent reductase (Old Yellow Enzyme family)
VNAQVLKYERLFSPIRINGLQLENRVVMAPTHDGHATDDGFVTPAMIDFYLKRAKEAGFDAVELIAAVMIRRETEEALDFFNQLQWPEEI